MRALIFYFLCMPLATAAATKPAATIKSSAVLKITNIKHHSAQITTIHKAGNEWICDSEAIKGYPMLAGLPKDEPWDKLKKVSRFNAKTLSCSDQVFIEKKQGAYAGLYQGCASKHPLNDWLNAVGKSCGR